MKKLSLALFLAILASSAHAGSATWTWPTARADGSALPLSAIGGFQVYDTSVPVPNLPGTPVTGCTAPIPPTTATGSCAAAFAVGHNHVIVIGDNTVPAILSATSNVATATTTLTPPRAVIDLKVIGP